MRLFSGTEFDRPPRCETCDQLEETCVCPPPVPAPVDRTKLTAKVAVEKRARGKWMTVVRGLDVEGHDLAALLTDLKTTCGAGGSVKQGEVEIQGRQDDRVRDRLSALGYRVR